MLTIIKKNFLLLIAGLWLPVNLLAQKQGQERIDSLLAAYPRIVSDTDRVMGLARLSFAYFPIDPSKGLIYGEKSLELAVKLKDLKGEAAALNSLGANYWAKRSFLKAQNFYLRALKINTNLNNKREMARNIHNIADVYAEFDTQKALIYYKKALATADELHEKVTMLGIQANIADIYDRRKEYPEAFTYLQKSVLLAKSLNRERDVAAYQSLMGVAECRMGRYEDALSSTKNALAIFENIAYKNPAKDDVARTLLNIAIIYQQSNDFENAIYYNKKALNALNKLVGNFDKNYAAECLSNIGRMYLDRAHKANNFMDYPVKDTSAKADLSEARLALEKAADIAVNTRQWVILTTVLKDLSSVQKLLGYPLLALQTFERYAAFKDSLYNADMNKSIALHQLEFEYNQEKDSLSNLNKLQAGKIKLLDQQRTVEKLRASQQWLSLLIAFILVCMVAFYFSYRYRLARIRLNSDLANEKMAKELQTAEYKRSINQNTLATLISQMNPHFIFNALNTIQSFIYSNEKKLASEYLGKFADLTRKILDNSRKQAISLDEELLLLNLYLDIEKARFGEELNITVEVSDQVDPETFFLPPMLVQPFVENAIKHGLMHSKKQKNLKVSINVSPAAESEIEIIIDDNGIGREHSMTLNAHRKDHQPFAYDANNKRIEIINNQLFDKKIMLTIIDKVSPDGIALGTTVLLKVPDTLN